MTQRVATECVAGEEHGVGRQHDAADADAEMSDAGSVSEPERLDGVDGQNDDEKDSEVQEVAMDVLQDQREESFAEIGLAWLADGTGHGVGPERFIVGTAVVITGEPETDGGQEKQQRRRKRQRPGPPARLRTEPGVPAIAKEQRRVERREVRAVFEM